MSPEALALAEQRIALEVSTASREFRHAVAQRHADYSSRGVGISSMMVMSVHEMARGELTKRALKAWAVCQRLLDADDSDPDGHARQSVLAVVAKATNELSHDIDEEYTRYRSMMTGDFPSLEEPRETAIAIASSEIDIDFLHRRRKRLPLGDVLRAPRYSASLSHWTKARALAEGEKSDTLGALREGVLAIEALAKVVAPGGGATLGECIKTLRAKRLLDAGADKILEGLWVYANAMPGTRHGSLTVADLAQQDWQIIKPMLEGAMVLLLSLDVTTI